MLKSCYLTFGKKKGEPFESALPEYLKYFYFFCVLNSPSV